MPADRLLAGKVAVVTGAGSGIGRAVALHFVEHGAAVLATGLYADELAETARLAGEHAERLAHVPADLRIPEQAEHAVQESVRRFGRLDIMFNGAGASGRRHGDGPVDRCTVEGWEWVMTTNLTSLFLCCKYGTREMLAGGKGGSVINLGSVLGMGGNPLFATHAYAAAKAAVLGLTRAMAVQYAPNGIRCNAIAPGLIETPMSSRAAADPAITAALPRLQPLTRAMGTAADVAGAALYLASDASRFVTGVILPVDGGWTAQ